MGELAEVTQQHYQTIEEGGINSSVLTLCALAGYFEVSADYLPGLPEEREHWDSFRSLGIKRRSPGMLLPGEGRTQPWPFSQKKVARRSRDGGFAPR